VRVSGGKCRSIHKHESAETTLSGKYFLLAEKCKPFLFIKSKYWKILILGEKYFVLGFLPYILVENKTFSNEQKLLFLCHHFWVLYKLLDKYCEK